MVARSSPKREVFVQGGKVYIYVQQQAKYVAITATDLVDLVNQQTSGNGGGMDAGQLEQLQTQIEELQQKVMQITTILDAVIPVR